MAKVLQSPHKVRLRQTSLINILYSLSLFTYSISMILRATIHLFQVSCFLSPLVRVFIWHCLLIFFPSKSSPKHVTSRVRGGEFRINKRILTLTLSLTLNLLLPSIVSYNKIFVLIMIFTALSFLRLIHGLFFIWGGNVS